MINIIRKKISKDLGDNKKITFEKKTLESCRSYLCA